MVGRNVLQSYCALLNVPGAKCEGELSEGRHMKSARLMCEGRSGGNHQQSETTALPIEPLLTKG